MKIPFSIALVAALLAVPALAQKPIHTIRVKPLTAEYPGEQSLGDMITARLISHLVAHGIPVVEGESDQPTDAILKVTCRFRAGRWEGPVRLTDMNGLVIWADEARGTLFAHSASASFAENIALKVEDFMFKQQQVRR